MLNEAGMQTQYARMSLNRSNSWQPFNTSSYFDFSRQGQVILQGNVAQLSSELNMTQAELDKVHDTVSIFPLYSVNQGATAMRHDASQLIHISHIPLSKVRQVTTLYRQTRSYEEHHCNCFSHVQEAKTKGRTGGHWARETEQQSTGGQGTRASVRSNHCGGAIENIRACCIYVN